MKKIISVLLSILMIFCLYGCGKEEASSKFNWNDIELKDYLPKLKIETGEINDNSDKYLDIDVYQMEKEDYKNYKKTCKNFGYTIDADDYDRSYEAFNNNGYKLELDYYESDKKISISLEAPEKMSEIFWPTIGAGSLLPIPETNIGLIDYESSDYFSAYLGQMPMESFHSYIKSCEDSGFIIDYEKGNDYYTAENSDGYRMEIFYKGFNTFYISIMAPKNIDESSDFSNDTNNEPEPPTEKVAEEKEPVEENETPEPEEVEPEKVETEKSDEMVNGMRKEFKEAMDSYESYMDSYVEFMKTYDSSSATALIEYSKMLMEYANLADKFEKWNDGTLNNAELSYYIEVQSRVNQKLLSIS